MEIVVFAFIAAAVIAWQIYSRQRRTDECEQWALANGFQFAGNNPCGLDELVFGLFRRGHSHKWRNVMIGRADGENLALADFQYTEGSGDDAHTSTYSIAVMHLPAFVPWVEIKGESLLTSLAGAVGFDDVQFESGEFNDRFLVRSADREFAYKLIDARMMEWLMITGLPIFEVAGAYALVAFERLHVADFDALTSHVRGFVSHIPRLVFADYGPDS